MNSEDNVCTIRDEDAFFPARKVVYDTVMLEFTKESIQIDDHSVSNHVQTFVANDSGRKDVEVVASSM